MRAGAYSVLLAALSVNLLTGCIRDNLPSCTTLHELYVRVAPPEPDELPAGAVDTAALFVFDGADLLLEVIGIGRTALVEGDPVEIRSCGPCRPRVVAWGNLRTSPVPRPVPGVTHLNDLRIIMPAGGEHAPVPDNLYYGRRALTDERIQTVVIRPAMGRLTVTARGLSREEGERYFFRVETQIEGYDFRRTPLPGIRVLRLDAVRREPSGDLASGEAVPLFAYPEENDAIEPLQVSLYRLADDGAHLVGQTDLDDKLLKIIPQAGRCVNVMMDFRSAGGIGIDIRITDWDVIELWENW